MKHHINPIPMRIPQQPDLCCAAVIATACEWMGIDYGNSLNNLAVRLGLHVNEKFKDMYTPELAKRALPEGHVDIGMTIDSLEQPRLIEKIKRELEGLVLKVHRLKDITEIDERLYNPSFAIPNLENFLENNLDKNRPIGINYRLEPFTGRKDGHYGLIFAYDNKNKDVYICEPSPFNRKHWKAPLTTFIRAMQAAWKEDDQQPRERGLITFAGPTKRKEQDIKTIIRFLLKVPKFIPANYRIIRYPSSPKERGHPYNPRNP